MGVWAWLFMPMGQAGKKALQEMGTEGMFGKGIEGQKGGGVACRR